jgi:hypothetical protein
MHRIRVSIIETKEINTAKRILEYMAPSKGGFPKIQIPDWVPALPNLPRNPCVRK